MAEERSGECWPGSGDDLKVNHKETTHDAAVTAVVKRIGYQDRVSAEMMPPVPFYKHCPEVLIPNSGPALRAILAW